MDRFQTGFVELQQFETGLKTLGICNYNGDPEVNNQGVLQAFKPNFQSKFL